jgi:hypothetical protein
MSLAELLLEIEARRDADPERDYAGSLTRADIEELKAWNPPE